MLFMSLILFLPGCLAKLMYQKVFFVVATILKYTSLIALLSFFFKRKLLKLFHRNLT